MIAMQTVFQFLNDHQVFTSSPIIGHPSKFLFSVSMSGLRAFWTSRIRAGSLNMAMGEARTWSGYLNYEAKGAAVCMAWCAPPTLVKVRAGLRAGENPYSPSHRFCRSAVFYYSPSTHHVCVCVCVNLPFWSCI